MKRSPFTMEHGWWRMGTQGNAGKMGHLESGEHMASRIRTSELAS